MKTYKNKITEHLFFFLSLCLSVCVFESPVQAQAGKAFQWVKQLGSDSWDISSGVVSDSKNNLYVAGSFYHTLHGSTKSVASAGNQDVFIAKYDEDGNIKDLWSAGGKGRDMATCLCITPGDNLALAGILSDTASFGQIKLPGYSQRLFVASLDAKGKFAWATTMAIDGDASLQMMSADAQGNLYVSGVFSGTLQAGEQKITSKGKKDIFLARLSKTGAVEKLFSMGGEENDVPGSLSVNAQGQIALCGTYGKAFQSGEMKFTEGAGATKTNAFVAIFDKDFDVQWTSLLSGRDYCQIASLKYDNQGNLYAAGSFSATLHVADTTLVSKGYTDAFLLKYATDGKLNWCRSFGSWYYDYATALNLDNLSGVVLTGSVGDSLMIDSLMIAPTSKGNAALVLQFSPRGKAIWGDCISGTGRNFSDGSALDKKGNLYLSGTFRNTFQKGGETLTSLGDQDVFLGKYDNCPASKAEVFGQRAICPGLTTEMSVKRGFKNVLWNDSLADVNHFTVYKPGALWVSMYDKQGCLLSDTLNIERAPLPVFSLGPDTIMQVGDSLLLQAPAAYTGYLWQDYSSASTLLAKSPDNKTGTVQYWLSVTDSLACSYTDTLVITFVKGYHWINLSTIQLVSYPNPVSDKVYWYVKTDQSCQLMAQLTDENGRVLYHQYLKEYQSGSVQQVDLSRVSVGTYYLRISDSPAGEKFKAVRVVKQ
jgi:hypothetical protein